MVEHVIAGVKRCRIVKDVLRLTKGVIADLVMEIACGLHNLRVSCRHPLPIFDLLNLMGSRLNPIMSDIAHLLWVTTSEHLSHQAIIVTNGVSLSETIK